MPTEIKVVNYITIHCSATRAEQNITEEDIRKWHLDRGWSDIGYHCVIRRNGMIEFGRPLDVCGAHVKGYNHNSIGICLVGGIDKKGEPESNYSCSQWRSLKHVVSGMKHFFPQAEVMGHRDMPFVNKACPCFDARKWWVDICSESCY